MATIAANALTCTLATQSPHCIGLNIIYRAHNGRLIEYSDCPPHVKHAHTLQGALHDHSLGSLQQQWTI